MHAYWSPLTLILKHPSVPKEITGIDQPLQFGTPSTLFLIKLSEVNQPLLSTSANVIGTSTLPDKLISAVDFTFGNIKPNKITPASTIVDTSQSKLTIIRQ